MARVIINVPVNTWNREHIRYVLPPMADDQANVIMAMLARAQRCSTERLGSDNIIVADPTGIISTEIADGDAVISKKEFALAAADAKRKQAEAQATQADEERRKAELMTA